MPCTEIRRARSPKAPQHSHNTHKRTRLATASAGYIRGTQPHCGTSRPFPRTCAGNQRRALVSQFPWHKIISISNLGQGDTHFEKYLILKDVKPSTSKSKT